MTSNALPVRFASRPVPMPYGLPCLAVIGKSNSTFPLPVPELVMSIEPEPIMILFIRAYLPTLVGATNQTPPVGRKFGVKVSHTAPMVLSVAAGRAVPSVSPAVHCVAMLFS